MEQKIENEGLLEKKKKLHVPEKYNLS